MNLPGLASLAVFCDVVEQKNFSRGARRSQLSQSAASQAVRQLEKHLGARLLDRATRPFTLTPEGKIFYEGCRKLLEGYRELEGRVRSQRGQEACRLSVAAIYSVVLYDMDRHVPGFMEQFPGGLIHFQYLHPNEVQRKVLAGEVDLGLVSFPKPNGELKVVPWKREPMALVCGADHAFAREGEIALSRLDGAEFVAFDEGLAIRHEVDSFLNQRGVEINPVAAFDNIEFIKRGVEAKGAVSILPEATVRTEINSGALALVPVEGLDLTRPLCIVHQRSRSLTPAMSRFIELLREDENGEAEAAPADGATSENVAPS